jgi:hypothetical protein
VRPTWTPVHETHPPTSGRGNGGDGQSRAGESGLAVMILGYSNDVDSVLNFS